MFKPSPNKANPFKKVSFLPLCIAFSLAFLLSASFLNGAQAAEKPVCLLDGYGTRAKDMLDCPTESEIPGLGGDTNAATGTAAARINPGLFAKTPVDPAVSNKCRYIDNNGSLSYFAPWGSAKEWQDFTYNDTRDALVFTHCARPFHDINQPNLLFFGPTSALEGIDGGARMYKVDLPYWRTGLYWPDGTSAVEIPPNEDIECCVWWGCQTVAAPVAPENTSKVIHTFNHTCQAPYATPYCFEWTTCCTTVVTGTSCDADGACTDTTTEVCNPCCARWGTVCTARSVSWTETFDFFAQALDSDVRTPSWIGQSACVGGHTRPSECFVTCSQSGESCNCIDPGVEVKYCPL